MGYHVNTRVLVLHCEHLVNAGITATLARQPDIELVEPCDGGDVEIVNWLVQHQVGVLITDYDRAIVVAAALQRTQMTPRTGLTRIMVVTFRGTQADIRNALKLGVGGYLTSACPTEEIVDAVRSVQIGQRHISETFAKSLLNNLLGEQLTLREGEVLRLAAQGFANKVIAARLGLELGTIKWHMGAILEKLGAGNRTEAVIIAHQRGLLALPSDSLSALDRPSDRRSTALNFSEPAAQAALA